MDLFSFRIRDALLWWGLCQGGPWDEFDYKCPPLDAWPPLHLAGSQQLRRDVIGPEHDRQLSHPCCPMQGSATMSCVDDKNINATEVQQELVTIDISESLLQLQELQESSSLQHPLLDICSLELTSF